MMHALDPAVHAPVFAAVQDLLPERRSHPLGCHRKRVPDHVCFMAIMIRSVFGLSWESTEWVMNHLAGHQVSDTTLRTRRNEWVDAGVFEQLAAHAVAGYHRLIGLDLNQVAIDGSDHLAPSGGKGAGHGFKHPGRYSWKWCIAVDATGIPFAWNIDAGNRNDYAMFFPLLDQIAERDLTKRIGTLSTDRGFNYDSTPERVAAYGITHFAAPPRQQRNTGTVALVGLGQRWIVEAANSWLRNYGQLRRNTDRKPEHRHATLCLAITCLIVHRLQDKKTSPIR